MENIKFKIRWSTSLIARGQVRSRTNPYRVFGGQISIAWFLLRVCYLGFPLPGHSSSAPYSSSYKYYCCQKEKRGKIWENSNQAILHGYTVHPIMLNTFYHQLTHTTLKNVELLKHSKIDKSAPTCFGLHGNHLQGAKVSTWLKVPCLVNSRCVKDVQGVVSAMAAYCDL